MPRTASKPGLRKKVDALLMSKGNIDQFVFLIDIVEAFGGPHRLAKTMAQEFENAPAGGLARQKFLAMVQHLIIACTTAGLAKGIDPSQHTDAELDAALNGYYERIEDGTLIPATAGASEAARESQLQQGEQVAPAED